MNIKGLDFLEEHIEKIVLVLVAIVCFWLFLSKVVISPNYVEYDGKNFTAGEIDGYIYNNQAKMLESKLDRPPEPGRVYEPKYANFVARLDSAISNIDPELYPPLPSFFKEDITKQSRRYAIPEVGEVTDIAGEHIRAVAYVPTINITPENSYEDAEHEPNDIDLVTVEAKFDAAKLYKNFHENYTGMDIRSEWRDPRLAEPIFAAVDLQRQELLADESWSRWQRVPCIDINPNKKLFQIIEDIDELPSGGMKVRLIQFDTFDNLSSLLQPQTYRIASANERWYPPRVHDKYEEYRNDLEAENRRKTAEEVKKEKEKESENRRGRGGTQRGGRTAGRNRGGTTGGMMSMMMNTGGGGRGAQRGRGGGFSQGRGLPNMLTGSDDTGPKKITLNDVEDEYRKIFITSGKKLSEMDEPLVFWSHDDTVKPNKTYRYKVRLGVFNPLAGTSQFQEEYKSFQDDVVLWSKFSEITETISIPSRLYFFPLSVQDGSGGVDIQVSKYVLGYWYSRSFSAVKPGESIGKVAKPKPLTEEEKKNKKDIEIPENINFDTGATLVDVVGVNEWIGATNLSPQGYSDILYSYDGVNIERMPVKSLYWANDLRVKYNQINLAEKQPREPLQGWSVSRVQVTQALVPKGERGEEEMGKGQLKMIQRMQQMFQGFNQ